MPEVRHFCPNVPFVLVGCKKDLRNDQTTKNELKKMSQEPVSEAAAQGVSSKIGAYSYLECSARTKVSHADPTSGIASVPRPGRRSVAI